jgi:hypothetical protein
MALFVRKNKNRSGSISIQIVQKLGKCYKIIKTIGCAYNKNEELILIKKAEEEIKLLSEKTE